MILPVEIYETLNKQDDIWSNKRKLDKYVFFENVKDHIATLYSYKFPHEEQTQQYQYAYNALSKEVISFLTNEFVIYEVLGQKIPESIILFGIEEYNVEKINLGFDIDFYWLGYKELMICTFSGSAYILHGSFQED